MTHPIPVRRRDDLNHAGGQTGLHHTCLQGCVNGETGADGFGAAAQDHGVARSHTERRRVRGDIGAGLVNHRDHTDRRSDAGDIEPIGPSPTADFDAQGIGNGGDDL
jgi:hypothetical protein